AGQCWRQSWHDLRFAQRRLVMESHSVSRKVLTLTGRLSIFRGEIVVDEDFIRTIESDNLEHWLWGRFRFLSGDDKSTWYWVLKNQYEMLYVPDAFCTTIENIEVNPYFRLQQNLLRWSGNMLRNGTRAILLGPRRVGLFIWWCLIDQRIAMWTVLTGPTLAVLLALVSGPQVLVAYVIWVVATRLALSGVLFFYAGGVYFSFPILLFLNQITTSAIKVHLLFRMSKQRWLNRGDQRVPAGAANMLAYQRFMAGFVTVFYVALLTFAIAVFSGALQLPHWQNAIGWLLHARADTKPDLGVSLVANRPASPFPEDRTPCRIASRVGSRRPRRRSASSPPAPASRSTRHCRRAAISTLRTGISPCPLRRSSIRQG